MSPAEEFKRSRALIKLHQGSPIPTRHAAENRPHTPTHAAEGVTEPARDGSGARGKQRGARLFAEMLEAIECRREQKWVLEQLGLDEKAV